MKKVAIVYHYIALYRLPIFEQLMNSDMVEYSYISGITSEIEIKKIHPNISKLPFDAGGLRWVLVRNFWFFKKKMLWQRGLISMIHNSDFDNFVFLGSPYFISTWIGALYARIRNKKVYFWMHGVYKDKLVFVDYIKLFVFYKLAHGFFLYGNRAANILKTYKVARSEDIHVIYNSLNYEQCLKFRGNFAIDSLTIFRKKYFSEADIPVICFIGRINCTKRLDFLLKAQSILYNIFNKVYFNLIFIGDGDERDKLADLSKSNNLSNNVFFTGALYDEIDISYILSNSDLCVTPGEIGLTAIHALSYGTPVISHNNLNIQMPEVEAIISGQTGSLYEHNDLDDLVRVIKEWLDMYPVKSSIISQNCMKIVDSYYNPHYQRKIFDAVLSS